MLHRHLDLDPDTPVAELPTAALDDLLERGSLAEWQPLLREIGRDPWGSLAQRVHTLVTQHELYGTSTLWRAWIEELRAASTPPFPAGPALRRAREQRGITQQEVANRLGTSQPEISKLERRTDVRLSTLRGYIAALGGSLLLVARFGEDERELR